MMKRSRRRFLGGVSVVGGFLLGGCSGGTAVSGSQNQTQTETARSVSGQSGGGSANCETLVKKGGSGIIHEAIAGADGKGATLEFTISKAAVDTHRVTQAVVLDENENRLKETALDPDALRTSNGKFPGNPYVVGVAIGQRPLSGTYHIEVRNENHDVINELVVSVQCN